MSVEFAAVLPLVGVAMLLVAQIGLLVAEQLTITHAAREGARAAAVTNDDDAARAAVLDAGNLDPERTTVTIDPAQRDVGEPVTVTVDYQPARMPIVGRFMPAVTLRSAASMRTERAPG